MVRVQCIRTGRVRVRKSQIHRKAGGPVRVLLDRVWTDWLPIWAWVIEHPEGVLVVDTGETAQTADPGYFPWWHPYHRAAVRFDVSHDQEIGPQLAEMGIDPAAVRTVVLTHLHTDHAGGLRHFPESRILVHGREYRRARGAAGRIRGYVPHRWPRWFAPTAVPFQPVPVGPFPQSYPVTSAGDVVIVPTPGHTPGHISVIVRSEDVSYFLAGDTSYTEGLLRDRKPDAVSVNRTAAVRTMDAILEYARAEPTVYLPSHDPQAAERLQQKQTLTEPARGTPLPGGPVRHGHGSCPA